MRGSLKKKKDSKPAAFCLWPNPAWTAAHKRFGTHCRLRAAKQGSTLSRCLSVRVFPVQGSLDSQKPKNTKKSHHKTNLTQEELSGRTEWPLPLSGKRGRNARESLYSFWSMSLVGKYPTIEAIV